MLMRRQRPKSGAEMRLIRTVAPDGMPLTVAQARAQAEYDSDHRDDLIADYIAAAVDLIDGPTGILGRAIVTQTWRLELDRWPACLIVPVEPVQSISVSYLDAAGAEIDLDASAHYLRQSTTSAPELHWAEGWSAPVLSAAAPYPVRMDIVAGFGDAGNCPAAIRQAIRMMVAHWIDFRAVVGDPGEIPLSVSALLARYRRMV